MPVVKLEPKEFGEKVKDRLERFMGVDPKSQSSDDTMASLVALRAMYKSVADCLPQYVLDEIEMYAAVAIEAAGCTPQEMMRYAKARKAAGEK